jgi:hypothetical protein
MRGGDARMRDDTDHSEDTRGDRGGTDIDINLKESRPASVVKAKLLPQQGRLIAHRHLHHPGTLSLIKREERVSEGEIERGERGRHTTEGISLKRSSQNSCSPCQNLASKVSHPSLSRGEAGGTCSSEPFIFASLAESPLMTRFASSLAVK